MVIIKRRFRGVKQNLKRARAYWEIKFGNKFWKLWKRQKKSKKYLTK